MKSPARFLGLVESDQRDNSNHNEKPKITTCVIRNGGSVCVGARAFRSGTFRNACFGVAEDNQLGGTHLKPCSFRFTGMVNYRKDGDSLRL